MNPIKTPQEMIYEEAGIPHLAGGGNPLSPGATGLLKSAIKRFAAVFGRSPNSEELSQLEAHANKFSFPTNTAPANLKRLEATTPAQNLMVDAEGRAYQPIHSIDQNKRLLAPEEAAGYNTDPFGSSAANFRAREGLYAPDVKAFESRDPFLTEAMTGRSTTRTRQKPFTTSIDELAQNKAHLENKGIYGDVADVAPGDYPTQSITPSADYFAEMAAKIEAAKLPTNIRSTLRDALKREPTEDEINAAIANLNVARHDYTGKGAAIFGERPQSVFSRPTKAEAAELADWRQRAIDSGQSRTSVMDSPRHIQERTPNLYQEMELGPDTGFAQGGSTSPKQMRADMMVRGYADGGVSIPGRGLGALGATTLNTAAEDLMKGRYGSAAANTAYGVQGLTTMAPKIAAKVLPASALRMIPGISSAFALWDAVKPNEDIATQEYEQADLARAPKTLAEAKALWAAQDAAKSKK